MRIALALAADPSDSASTISAAPAGAARNCPLSPADLLCSLTLPAMPTTPAQSAPPTTRWCLDRESVSGDTACGSSAEGAEEGVYERDHERDDEGDCLPTLRITGCAAAC